VTFGGTVYDKAKDGAPQPGIDVAIKGTGFLATTDDDGHYILGSVEPGDYTLVLWPPKGKPKEKKVSIPGRTEDYDLVL
jgi:protocatechuate 3,4-dioxygenase beta subunit